MLLMLLFLNLLKEQKQPELFQRWMLMIESPGVC